MFIWLVLATSDPFLVLFSTLGKTLTQNQKYLLAKNLNDAVTLKKQKSTGWGQIKVELFSKKNTLN